MVKMLRHSLFEVRVASGQAQEQRRLSIIHMQSEPKIVGQLLGKVFCCRDVLMSPFNRWSLLICPLSVSSWEYLGVYIVYSQQLLEKKCKFSVGHGYMGSVVKRE